MPPRGGARGGFGGGRPRPAAGKVRIGGIDIEVDEETQGTEHDSNNQPSQTFPPYQVAIARPLTETEKIEIARYRSIRDRIHKGPLYTTIEDAPLPKTQGRKRKSMGDTFDAFNGMETYSMKYTTKQRRAPQLSSRPFVLEFFPAELHATLDPKVRGNAPRQGKKTLQTDFDLEDLELDAVAEGKELDDEDAAKPAPEDGDEAPEEVVDNDYEEDEDDGPDDYNAEQYFDDGEKEDDLGDDDGGGGGDEF